MASKKKNGKSKADSKKVNEEILNEPVKEEAEAFDSSILLTT